MKILILVVQIPRNFNGFLKKKIVTDFIVSPYFFVNNVKNHKFN